MTNSGNRKLIRAMSSNEGLEHKFGTKLKHHTINMNDGMPNSDSLKMSITPINNTSKMHGANGGFVAPMRGRGFGRGTGTNRGDMFRSRPPNTSRPPSMHVDDSGPSQGNLQVLSLSLYRSHLFALLSKFLNFSYLSYQQTLLK